MLNLQQFELFIILFLAFGLLLTERLSNDIVALLVVLALYLTGILTTDEALSGLSSEPAIIVVSMFVLGAGLRQTGLDEIIGNWIGRLAGTSYNRALAVIMPLVALFAAFTNDITTTAVMMPVTLNLSRARRIPASKLLMPLSFAASLGATITLVGAPAFLVASHVLEQLGHAPLSLFSIAPIGIAISLLGTLFMLAVGQFILPCREDIEDPSHRYRLDNYLTEVSVPSDSPFLGKTLADMQAADGHNLDVIGWFQAGRRVHAPFNGHKLQAEDVLLVRTSAEEMIAIRHDSDIALKPLAKYGGGENGNRHADDPAEDMVQVVVAPSSDLIGRTIGEIDFRRRYGAIVMGIWRQRSALDQELAHVRLRAGDVLVVKGEQEALNRFRQDPSFLLMVPFEGEQHFRRKAPLAAMIMLGTILLAALRILPLGIATLGGALCMVLTRCVTSRQAYRSIDQRIYVFIAGAIPLGFAMQKTGAAQLVAGGLELAVGGWNETLILLVLFGLVAVITQFMDDAAATAVFAPIAVALATSLHQSPEAYVVTVTMAAVAAFLTPTGHNGNLLVYGPGRYHFSDYVRVGSPLTLLIGLTVAIFTPLLWGG